MGKIDTLRAEIQKQGTVYGDVLVGMHADITEYKKNVELQRKATDRVLEEAETTKVKVEILRLKATSLMDKSVKLFEELNKKGNDVKRIAKEFDARMETYSEELAHYKKNLSQREEALVRMVRAYKSETDIALISLRKQAQRNKKSFMKYGIAMLIFFSVNLMLFAYLYHLFL